VGSPIELYGGPISVDSADPLPGRIVVDLAGDLQVRWNVIGVVRPFRPGHVSLGIDLPDFGSITVPAQLNRGRGAGMIMYATVGDRDAECGHTIAHVTTCP
jgi:hypothetical protein